MKITMEMSLYNFKAWGGAVDALERIKEAGLCDDCTPLNDVIEMINDIG